MALDDGHAALVVGQHAHHLPCGLALEASAVKPRTSRFGIAVRVPRVAGADGIARAADVLRDLRREKARQVLLCLLAGHRLGRHAPRATDREGEDGGDGGDGDDLVDLGAHQDEFEVRYSRSCVIAGVVGIGEQS